jgi:hypothetical protein
LSDEQARLLDDGALTNPKSGVAGCCTRAFWRFGPTAADEIRRHAKELEDRSLHIRDALRYLIDTLDGTAAATAPSSPS